jgi:hypothetical protein
MNTEIEIDDEIKMSSCCGFEESGWYDEDSGICGNCGEHCDYMTERELENE